MFPPMSDVTALIAIHLISPDSEMIMVSLRLNYYVADPYAVHAHFTPADGPTTTRVLARDLIDLGLDATQAAPVGLGDVRVWRGPDPDYMLMTVDGDQGRSLFITPAEPVQRFLLVTHALVPEGSESSHISAAVDALLASILTS